MVQKEKLEKYYYAMLIDKCLIELTGKQQYGTQYFISNNKKVLFPIIDILKIVSSSNKCNRLRSFSKRSVA